MKAVKVQYTVKPEFVDQNMANIRNVMEALRSRPITGMWYASFTLDDEQTFVHISMAKDQDTMDELDELKEFGEFREALMASGFISPPASENLNLVDAGFDV